MATVDPWIPYRRTRPGARARLFCFAHAGGGASTFRSWAEGLPPEVEVCAVQLPGREGRIGEPAFSTMERLIPILADALRPYLDRPFAFFGHSLGSLISFELARELRRRGGVLPLHLFASGCRAPGFSDLDIIHDKSDAELLERLRALGGIDDALLAHDELMQILLPTLRADASVSETYVLAAEPPLDGALTVLGGLDDPRTKPEGLAAWRAQTRGPFALAMFPGGHFFLRGQQAEVLNLIADGLRTSLRQAS